MTKKDDKKVVAGRAGGLAAAKVNKENGTGVWGITPEQRREIMNKVHSQKWMSLETGMISNAGSVARHNSARGKSKDARILLTIKEFDELIETPMDERVKEFEALRK